MPRQFDKSRSIARLLSHTLTEQYWPPLADTITDDTYIKIHLGLHSVFDFVIKQYCDNWIHGVTEQQLPLHFHDGQALERASSLTISLQQPIQRPLGNCFKH